MPCGTPRGPPSFRSLAAPCSFPRTSFFARRAHPSEDERSRIPAARGHRYERGWGEIRFTTEPSLRRPAGALERRRFFLCEKPDTDRLWHPCRILLPACSGSHFIERRALVRRPPRPVPREPRERRALLRSGMPSIGSRCAQRARAEARTSPRSLLREDSAHVMRIAALRKITLRLPDGDLERLHARESPPVRLPFTRSWSPAWLSTIPVQVARFFEPEGVLPTSAIRRGTGTYRERRWLLVLREEVTNLSAPSSFAVPLRGRLGLTSLREGPASEETRPPAWTGPSRVKVRAAVSAGEAPPRAEYRAPLSSCERCFERRNLSCFAPAPGGALRVKRGTPPFRPPRPASSREGRCVRTETEVRSTVVRSGDTEDCSPVRPSGTPFHAAPVPRRTPTLCRKEPIPSTAHRRHARH